MADTWGIFSNKRLMESILVKTIDGHSGKYRIDSDGNVWVKMKGTLVDNRYYHVHLRGDGPGEMPTIHKLVAQAFIPNPENKPEVHHIDGNTLNNHVGNLMWVTKEEHDAFHYEPRVERLKKIVKGKKVYQYSLNGELVNVWESAVEAAEQNNLINGSSSITKCCRGAKHYHTAYGYIWSYTSLS